MSWHAKTTGGYIASSIEGRENGTEIANVLLLAGWHIDSVAALLGNGAGESGLNPWRWESDVVPTVAQFRAWTPAQAQSHGYGLLGFTPASSYINDINAGRYTGYAPNFADAGGSPTDGAAQIAYFNETVEPNWLHALYTYYKDDFDAIEVNIDEFYWMTFEEFKSGAFSMPQLVGAFELCYEKPADYAAASSYAHRLSQALNWKAYFAEHPPQPVPPTPKRRKLPLIYYIRRYY